MLSRYLQLESQEHAFRTRVFQNVTAARRITAHSSQQSRVHPGPAQRLQHPQWTTHSSGPSRAACPPPGTIYPYAAVSKVLQEKALSSSVAAKVEHTQQEPAQALPHVMQQQQSPGQSAVADTNLRDGLHAVVRCASAMRGLMLDSTVCVFISQQLAKKRHYAASHISWEC